MKYVIAVLALMVSMSTFAIDSRDIGSAGFEKLSATQKAQVVANVEAMSKQAESPLIDTVDKYVNIGERMGKMLGGAAKELGVQVNEFSKTPVGQMTTVLIIWKLIGSDIVHVLGGVTILMIGFPFILYMVRRARTLTVTYDTTKNNIFGNYPITSKQYGELDSSYAGGYTFAAAVVVAAALLTVFTM
jgi:hypothetical protein